MKAVWKYELKIGFNALTMPEGAQPLTFALQNDRPCIWALVDLDADTTGRVFEVLGTGFEIDEIERKWIGTDVSPGGTLVFHCFEVLR